LRKHEARAPHPTRRVPTPRSRDRPLAAGRRFDRHAGSNAEGARAPERAFNVGTAEIDDHKTTTTTTITTITVKPAAFAANNGDLNE
jgi:hypothetical protein